MNNQKHISDSAKYWQDHLTSWEASAYFFKEGQQNANWWDKLSTIFRGDAMYVRMNTALELVKPHISGKTVLDVGCASGRFAFQMIQAGAQKAYGTDISKEALDLAKQRGIELGLQNKMEFSVNSHTHDPHNACSLEEVQNSHMIFILAAFLITLSTGVKASRWHAIPGVSSLSLKKYSVLFQ